MVILGQRDYRWSGIRLTPSKLTCGRYGCTTTCISMLSDYFKCFRMPSEVIGTNIKYTKDGLIMWEAINFPKFAFEKRVRTFDPSAIQVSLKDPKKAVILEVDHSHWVVALSKNLFGGYNIADPWTGKKSTTRSYRAVTGSAHFKSIN